MESTAVSMHKLFDFGVAVNLMSYYAELDMISQLMTQVCKKANLTFHKYFKALVSACERNSITVSSVEKVSDHKLFTEYYSYVRLKLDSI